jgi:hypothetical protein
MWLLLSECVEHSADSNNGDKDPIVLTLQCGLRSIALPFHNPDTTTASLVFGILLFESNSEARSNTVYNRIKCEGSGREDGRLC